MKVGELQATALVDKLKADGKTSGTLVQINGDPSDNNAKLFAQGADSVLSKSGYKIGFKFETWDPVKAQNAMDQAITKLGKSGFIGVYSANDGDAGGAIASMKSNGVDVASVPVTGQDAELPAIQRIISGQQYMTVYKAIKPEAEKAAEIAVQLAQGQKPASTSTVNNGKVDVPSFLLTPVAVTKDKVKDTIVADGFWKASQICTGSYASACSQLGIS
jgi:D-xylose transport system substrate-binding protein